MRRFLRHISLGLAAVYPLLLQAQSYVTFDSPSDLATYFNVSPTSSITTQTNNGTDNSGSLLLNGDPMATNLNLAVFKTGSALLAGRSYTSSYLISWDEWNAPLFSIGYTNSASLASSPAAGALENNPLNAIAFNLTDTLTSTQVSSTPLPVAHFQSPRLQRRRFSQFAFDYVEYHRTNHHLRRQRHLHRHSQYLSFQQRRHSRNAIGLLECFHFEPPLHG